MQSLIGDRELIALGMSNYDHAIDNGLAEALRTNRQAVAQYSGWNFCAYVWAEEGLFVCEVWRYKAPRQVFRCDSLEEVMAEVCAEFGSE